MKSEIEARQINAFVDAELDLASQPEIEERMRLDAGLRARVEGLRQLRETIREGADYHASPTALRKRMTTLIAPKLSRLALAPKAFKAGRGTKISYSDTKAATTSFVPGRRRS